MKRTLKDAQKEINILDYTDYRQYLKEVYEWLKSWVKPYSYRIFSQELGFSNRGYIQLVIQGKRNLTDKSIKQVIQNMGFKKLKSQYFQALVTFNQLKDPTAKALAYKALKAASAVNKTEVIDKKKYAYLSNWYNVVLRELLNLPRQESSVDWLYDQLLLKKIPKTKIKTSLKLLQELGIIKLNNNGKLELVDQVITTGDEIQGVAVKNLFIDLIDMAKTALIEVTPTEREYGSQTLSISENGFEQIREKVRQFRKDIMQIVSEDQDPTRVYQVNIQVFPLSKDKK